METSSQPSTGLPIPTMGADATDQWELADQWKLSWKSLKWVVSAFICIGALVAVGQIYLFHQIFADIHWSLGWTFTAIITGLTGWFIALPLARFLKSPSIAAPPDVDLSTPSISPIDVLRRLSYDAAYLKGLAKNPELADQRDAIDKARYDLTDIKKILTGKNEVSGDIAKEAAQALNLFERNRIAPLLKDLDKRVDSYIHKEALAVGTATTVSLNGSVDAFIVLWRNINMVARISRLYYGRPSLRLTLMILRDVMTAVLLSRALDDVTDAAGEALGGLVTRLGGLVVGPMLDGSVNALMTTKLGYLAKRRCRSFDVWNEASAQRATRDVFEQVKRESASLIGDLIKACGGFLGTATDVAGGVVNSAGEAVGTAASVAADAAGKVLKAPKSAWSLVQDTFVKKPAEKN